MEIVSRLPSLRHRALEEVRKGIVTGLLEAGALYSEQVIATRLGLSRTPIREALLQLVGEGLVVFVPNCGVRIAEFDPEHLAHVLQFRAAIEGCGASRAAAAPSPAGLRRLEAELKRQREIVKNSDRLLWVDANMEFHTLVAECSENKLMLNAFAPLASHTKRLGYRMNNRATRMKESVDEHTAIVDAIRRGDPDRARTMTEEHLYVTTVLMKQLFADLGIEERGAGGLKMNRGRRIRLA